MLGNGSYTRSPCYPELAAIGLAGLVHIGLEVGISERAGLWFSAAAAMAFVGYLVWRARGGSAVRHMWGMRRDNFWSALRAQLVFGACGATVMIAYAATVGAVTLPWGFWLTLVLYPVWGTIQQFALQNLIARNVIGFVSHPIAVAAAVLFATSHIPRWPLVALTLVSGFFFTLIYRRRPNLWAVGIVHGVLGSLAVYLVSGEDPGAVIWNMVTRW